MTKTWQDYQKLSNGQWPKEDCMQAVIDDLTAALGKPEEERMAPVQGYTPGIPWSMHLAAYDVYRKKYGAQQSLIEGWCRGGFGTGELDEFIPGWRDEVSEIGKLKAEVAKHKALHHDCAGQLRLALSERDALATELAEKQTSYMDGFEAAKQEARDAYEVLRLEVESNMKEFKRIYEVLNRHSEITRRAEAEVERLRALHPEENQS